mgnify:CR=1 FL=1
MCPPSFNLLSDWDTYFFSHTVQVMYYTTYVHCFSSKIAEFKHIYQIRTRQVSNVDQIGVPDFEGLVLEYYWELVRKLGAYI